jgi:hypothetical protein
MRPYTLLSLALAGFVFTACQQSRASSTAAATPADEPLVKKIELRDGENRPVTLEASMTSTPVAATSPALSAQPLQPSQQPAAVLPPPPKPVAPAPYDGAVVENLGPCNGKGVAGYATINGEKKPICGQDGSIARSPQRYPYGSNRYGYRRSTYRTPYNP